MLTAVAAPEIRAQVSAVTVDVALEQEQFLPSEDVRVAVRVTNRSGQSLQLGKEDNWITFSIQARDRYVVKQLGDVPMASAFTLESSKTGTRRANLTPYFDFREAGRYEIIATVKIPQWDKEVSSKSVSFDIITGTKLKEMDFGVPTTATNAAPEMRKYILQQAVYLKEMKLYFRLTDSTGSTTLRVFPIARMVTFSQPEMQVDKASNLHVLHQTGARAFNYCVINPDGEILLRQTHEYTNTRPTLKMESDGNILVRGGVQRMSSAVPAISPNKISPSQDAPTQP